MVWNLDIWVYDDLCEYKSKHDWYNIGLLQETLLKIVKYMEKLLLSLGLYHSSEIKSPKIALSRLKSPKVALSRLKSP